MKGTFKKLFAVILSLALCFGGAGCGDDVTDVIDDVIDEVKAKATVIEVIDGVSLSSPVYLNIKGKVKTTENGKITNTEGVAYGGIKLSEDLKSFELFDADLFSVSTDAITGYEDLIFGEAQFYRGGKNYGVGSVYYENKSLEEVKIGLIDDLSAKHRELTFMQDVNDIFKDIASPAPSEVLEEKPGSAFEAVPAVNGVLKGMASFADISVNGDVYTIDCLSTVIKVLNYVKAITAVIDANPELTLGELYNDPAVQVLAKPVFGSISAKDALIAAEVFTAITPETIKQETGLVLPEPGDKNFNDYLAQIISECSFVFGEGETAVKVGVGSVKIRDMFKGGTKADPDGDGADSGEAPADEWKNLTPVIDKAVAEVNDVLKVLKISLTIVNKKVTSVKINANFNEEQSESVDDNPPVIIKYNIDLVLECELLDAMPELCDVTEFLPEADS